MLTDHFLFIEPLLQVNSDLKKAGEKNLKVLYWKEFMSSSLYCVPNTSRCCAKQCICKSSLPSQGLEGPESQLGMMESSQTDSDDGCCTYHYRWAICLQKGKFCVTYILVSPGGNSYPLSLELDLLTHFQRKKPVTSWWRSLTNTTLT